MDLQEHVTDIFSLIEEDRKLKREAFNIGQMMKDKIEERLNIPTGIFVNVFVDTVLLTFDIDFYAESPERFLKAFQVLLEGDFDQNFKDKEEEIEKFLSAYRPKVEPTTT